MEAILQWLGGIGVIVMAITMPIMNVGINSLKSQTVTHLKNTSKSGYRLIYIYSTF